MTKTLALLSAAALGCSLAPAAWAQQKLLAQHSRIEFTFEQLGVPVTGHFKAFEGEIALKLDDLPASDLHLDVDTGSATLGDAQTDAELRKAAWFDTAAFPKARFALDKLQATGKNEYQAHGTLTIKNISHPVQVPVRLEATNGHAMARGSFTIERLPYQVGSGEWSDTSVVANPVRVQFQLAIEGLNAAQ
ncbi:polyisoprenoid-binding protein [Vandammella animalimorsus]|uniref:Polyisoprenoid-binding protein n=1 Tax=Vandammella animalimorsus TaxID=2029117 RepID=A0A2A2AHM3_9BURK|nr:YceI family protein [Vandammella animalimorsus]PAT37109.1 polyisoprenoid-binding protein [Vandammella animalimorsus]PAT40666.1 polyisoprenoid-binding protein [Vandammella animalimorsus]